MRPARRSFRAWVLRHVQTFFYSLGVLTHTPLATFLTTAVIGVALALPGALAVLLDNVQRAAQGWDGAAEVSLFLKPKVSDSAAQALAAQLRKHDGIDAIRVITRSQALAEFQRLAGFAEVLDALEEDNPLPAVLVLEPKDVSAPAVARLLEQLQTRAEVDTAQFDLQWLKRLQAIVNIAQRGVAVIAVLLGIGVLLVIGNTIRLDIQNRREEIEIAKLFGATDAFVRRPFLYTGAIFGALGGIGASLLVWLAVGLLDGPLADLAGLYGSEFRLLGADFSMLGTLVGGGVILGLAGSWLAVGRHVQAIEPQ